MNSNKQPAGLKLTSLSGEQTFYEVATGVKKKKKNYCLIDTEINYIMGITKLTDPIPYLFIY